MRLTGLLLHPAERRGAWFGRRYVRDGDRLGPYRLQVFANGAVLWDDGGNATALRVGDSVALPGVGE